MRAEFAWGLGFRRRTKRRMTKRRRTKRRRKIRRAEEEWEGGDAQPWRSSR